MRKIISLFLLISMLLTLFCGCNTAGGEKKVSMLFVGNDFVYTGDIPGQIRTLAKMYGVSVTSRSICPDGAALSGTRYDAIAAMKGGKYDYVVIQDFGTRPLLDEDGFLADVKLLCDAARESGAVPVLYNPAWALENATNDQSTYQIMETKAYEEAAKESGAVLVNAGDAWVYAYQEVPGIYLYQKGDYHASDEGAYLTACVFCSTLFGLEIKDAAKHSLYQGDYALQLGKAAWEYVSYYNANGTYPASSVTVPDGINEKVSD